MHPKIQQWQTYAFHKMQFVTKTKPPVVKGGGGFRLNVMPCSFFQNLKIGSDVISLLYLCLFKFSNCTSQCKQLRTIKILIFILHPSKNPCEMYFFYECFQNKCPLYKDIIKAQLNKHKIKIHVRTHLI
jgi:hypothetical protein